MTPLPLPPPPPRYGVIPQVRLAAARIVKHGLNAKPGFADMGLLARVTIRNGSFAVHVTHPIGEPLHGMAREIDGVPIIVGPKYVERPRR